MKPVILWILLASDFQSFGGNRLEAFSLKWDEKIAYYAAKKWGPD